MRGRLAPEPAASTLDKSSAKPAPETVEARIWQALGHDPVSLDQLQQRTALTVPALSAMLLTMELSGLLSVCEGRYSRRS